MKFYCQKDNLALDKNYKVASLSKLYLSEIDITILTCLN